MRNLLDSNSKCIVAIIDYLLNNKEWVTISKLANEIHYSSRTIQRNLSFIRDHYSDHICLNITQKNGVRLESSNISNISLIYSDLFNKTIALQFLKNILLYPEESLAFHEKQLFSSRSTLLRTVQKINEELSPLGMTVVLNQHTLTIITEDEYVLRDFFACFFLELYGNNLTHYDFIVPLDSLRLLVTQVINNVLEVEEAHFKIEDETALSYTMMLCLISLIRESQGYCAVAPPIYPIEKNLERLVLSFKKDLPALETSALIPIFDLIRLQHNNWSSEDEYQLVMFEIELCVDKITRAFKMDLPESFKYQIMLYLKCLYSLNKTRPYTTSLLFNRIRYFANEVKKENAFFYQVVEDQIEDLSRLLNNNIITQINSAIYWMIQIFPPFSFIHPSKTLLIIDDFGKNHANYIKQSLLHALTIDGICSVDIVIAKYPDFQDELKARDYDLVVSTIYSPLLNDYPLITIGDFISTNAIIKILDALYER